MTSYRRYVAIGDSSTEGLDDPDGSGGYRGWADRLAASIAASQGHLLYANLAVRGRRTPEIRAQQFDRALAMEPDLVTLFSGTNDVVALRFDLAAVAADIGAMQKALVASGATVLTFTLPDLAAVMPLARLVARRLRDFNAALRELSRAHGVRLVDFEAHPVAADARLWSADRLHANPAGHARIAAALAEALGLTGADRRWAEPLPAMPRRSALARLRRELDWGRRFLVPWLWRHARGRSSGDGRLPKRPVLAPVRTPDQPDSEEER